MCPRFFAIDSNQHHHGIITTANRKGAGCNASSCAAAQTGRLAATSGHPPTNLLTRESSVSFVKKLQLACGFGGSVIFFPCTRSATLQHCFPCTVAAVCLIPAALSHTPEAAAADFPRLFPPSLPPSSPLHLICAYITAQGTAATVQGYRGPWPF